MGWEADGEEAPGRPALALRIATYAQAAAAAAEMDPLWSRAPSYQFVTAPTWPELHAMGMTARQAAEARGVNVRTAYGWAERQGVKWKRGTWRR